MGVPQLLILSMMAFATGHDLAVCVRDNDPPGIFVATLIVRGVMIAILAWGGFFGG